MTQVLPNIVGPNAVGKPPMPDNGSVPSTDDGQLSGLCSLIHAYMKLFAGVIDGHLGRVSRSLSGDP